mgnify:CR=1 FL=1
MTNLYTQKALSLKPIVLFLFGRSDEYGNKRIAEYGNLNQ